MPEGHPISADKAKELMAGPLADVYRNILKKSCAPIFWYWADRKDRAIMHNGTVTFAQTPEGLLGITAGHVLRAYLADAQRCSITLQIWDAHITDMRDRIISLDDHLDIGTFRVDERLLKAIGKEIVPLGNWPPRPPQERRGIMLAGYPAVERKAESNDVTFGLFTALVIARTVTDKQITWLIEPDAQLPAAKIPAPPPRYGLGGVSGGPLISWFESKSYIATYTLSGIITEHPDYEQNEFTVERVIAVRADVIQDSGRIAN